MLSTACLFHAFNGVSCFSQQAYQPAFTGQVASSDGEAVLRHSNNCNTLMGDGAARSNSRADLTVKLKFSSVYTPDGVKLN